MGVLIEPRGGVSSFEYKAEPSSWLGVGERGGVMGGAVGEGCVILGLGFGGLEMGFGAW